MSEHQDHVGRSLEGQHTDPGEDLGTDAMRWSPEPVSGDGQDDASRAAAVAHALLDRAAAAYTSLLDTVLGDGTHHMVASATTPVGEVTERQDVTLTGEAVILNEVAAMRVCAAIATAMLECARGGLVVRSFAPDGSESVRGWAVQNGWLRPLTAQDIQAAYSYDAGTGTPLEPEPGVDYRQAEHVPHPDHEQPETNNRATSRTTPRDNRPPNRHN
ncbi:hypothetical protein [Streptomyces cadmiisoli]|uniref:hypothetical protein n=1 Tax=Streptomyces cadmiisoli TaxID=2184053 RepID=UPI00365A5440